MKQKQTKRSPRKKAPKLPTDIVLTPEHLPEPTFRLGITRSSRHADTLAVMRALREEVPGLRVYTLDLPGHARHVDKLDGVLIGGGGDISPRRYGEANWGALNIDYRRDELEAKIIENALSAAVPIMGICRGAQMINVVLGGKLHQDLQEDLGLVHAPEHPLYIDDLLHNVTPTFAVNSSHHQGIKTVGEGLEVVGWSPDGLPEAWWCSGVYGVQYHPESLAVSDPRWLAPFRWLLSGLKEGRRAEPGKKSA